MRPSGVLSAVGGASIGAAAIAGMAWAVRGRSSTFFGPSIHRAPIASKRLARTFDDGPSSGTEQLLQILAGYQVPATFFQCGQNVLRDQMLARSVSEAGHEIGNHS